MMSPSSQLEKVLGAILTGDAELKAILSTTILPVVSYARETDVLPFIVYNETRLAAWDDDRKQGGEHTILISVRYGGESEAVLKDALHRIRQLWSRVRADISPYKLVIIDFQLYDIQQEADGQAWRGTAQYRAITGGH